MSRVISTLIIFSITLNLFSNMLIASGAAATLGLGNQVEIGGDKAAQTAQDESSEVETGSPTGSTLFGMYNVLTTKLGQIRAVVFAAPYMLYNAGVPGAITGMFEVLFGIVYTMGIIKFLRGFSF